MASPGKGWPSASTVRRTTEGLSAIMTQAMHTALLVTPVGTDALIECVYCPFSHTMSARYPGMVSREVVRLERAHSCVLLESS